jgi:anti-anti-sigma regulatory factor
VNSRGALATLTGPGRRGRATDRFAASDHACWGYATAAERAEAAAEWLLDGLRQGQRAMYVGDDTADNLVDDLAGMPNRDALLRDGSLLVHELTELYDTTKPIDSHAQLAVYDRAVRQAIEDGFHGIRATADITALVTDPSRRPAHVHWEQVADRYMTDDPLALLCLYDARCAVDIEAIVDCHPMQGPDLAPFALYGTRREAGALAGELDLHGHRGLESALAGLPRTDRTLDVSRLSFIDGHAADLLHSHLVARREAGQRIVVSGASPTLQRIWSICRFDASVLA